MSYTIYIRKRVQMIVTACSDPACPPADELNSSPVVPGLTPTTGNLDIVQQAKTVPTAADIVVLTANVSARPSGGAKEFGNCDVD